MLFTVILNRNQDFQRLYRMGAFCPLGSAFLYALPNKLPYNRLGITAGKKVGNAVVRNLVKRRLRAIVTELLPDIKKGYSYVLVARSGIQDAPFQSLRRDVCDLFGRVK